MEDMYKSKSEATAGMQERRRQTHYKVRDAEGHHGGDGDHHRRQAKVLAWVQGHHRTVPGLRREPDLLSNRDG